MELAEANDRLKAIEGALAGDAFVEFYAFEREGHTLHLAVTERLRKAARKEGVGGPGRCSRRSGTRPTGSTSGSPAAWAVGMASS
jgi:hypothetical protein